MSVSDEDIMQMLNKRHGIFKLKIKGDKPYYSDKNISVFILENELTNNIHAIVIAFKKELYMVMYEVLFEPYTTVCFQIVDGKIKYCRNISFRKDRQEIIDSLMKRYPQATACLAAILI